MPDVMMDAARPDGPVPDHETIIPLNQWNRIRVAVSEYQGKIGLDIRQQFIDEGADDPNEWHWGKGLRLRPDKVDEVLQAIHKCREALHRMGLIK